MKKLSILLITLFALNTVNAQWVQLSSGTSNNLHSVFFIDSNTGFVVGDNGTILKTTNGGANWVTIYTTNSSASLYSVYFLNSDTGYAVGNMIILKTTNGGTNWISQNPQGNSNELYSVFFTNDTTGYAVGGYGTYIKTTNGGSNWSVETFQTSGIWPYTELYSVYFPTKNTGYIVGYYAISMSSGGAYFAKTTDGGTNWVSLLPNNLPSQTHLYSVYFTDSITGYAVSDGGIIIKTTNGGTNWIIQYPFIPPYNNLNCVFFPDSNTGYAVGNAGTIFKTTNGGTWIEQEQTENNKLLLYPNPAKNKITIDLQKISDLKNTYISIYNLQGQLLLQKSITQEKTELHINNLAKGMYIVKVYNNNNTMVTKFVKE